MAGDIVPLCPTWLQVSTTISIMQSGTTVISDVAQRIAELSVALVVHALEGLMHLIHIIGIIFENLLAAGIVLVLSHSCVGIMRVCLEHVLLH